tara:strand:- start:61 stop:540 length:480 start_codon:yes stop_codon:yes gene_type:complete
VIIILDNIVKIIKTNKMAYKQKSSWSSLMGNGEKEPSFEGDKAWETENKPTIVRDEASGRDYSIYKNKLGEVINVSGTGGYGGSTSKAGEQVWWSGKDAVKMSKALARNADEATRAAAERTFKSKNPKARIDYIKYANAITDADKKSQGILKKEGGYKF